MFAEHPILSQHLTSLRTHVEHLIYRKSYYAQAHRPANVCLVAYVVELHNDGRDVSLFHLLIAPLQQHTALVAGAYVKVTLSAKHRVQTTVASRASKTFTFVRKRRIGQLP